MRSLFIVLCLLSIANSFIAVSPLGPRRRTFAQQRTAITTTHLSMSLILSSRDHLNRDVKLILASQSPRRREILDMMGLAGLYTVQPSPLDESALQLRVVQSNDRTMTPQQYTLTLAQEKAKALAVSLIDDHDEDVHAPATLVLGSDTIVDLDGMILEKPKDEASAKAMLSALSAKSHRVHTAVALYHVVGRRCTLVESFVDTALVTFVSLREEDIMNYIATQEPMDKAGSYGIQGMGGQFVECITGDFFSVMGLPMHRTSKLLTKGVEVALANQRETD
jgi:septum formation protein